MEKFEISMPLNPNEVAFAEFASHLIPKNIDANESRIIFSFGEDSTEGEITYTKIALPLLTNDLLEKEIIILKIDINILADVRLNYLPDPNSEYLILFHLKVDKDFIEETYKGNVKHKKGDWIIATTSYSTKSYSLHYEANTLHQGLTIFIPIKGISPFLNADSESYLQRVLRSEETLLIYEPGNIRLKNLFNDIMTNNISSITSLMSFQELISSFIGTVFEQLGQNSILSLKHNLKLSDIESIEKAKQLLLKDIKEPPAISVLASEAAMSLTKFKDSFKKLYGKTVYQYYLDYRMRIAHNWLIEKKLNITEIAGDLGYVNVTHFSRTFKKYYGELPSKYLENLTD